MGCCCVFQYDALESTIYLILLLPQGGIPQNDKVNHMYCTQQLCLAASKCLRNSSLTKEKFTHTPPPESPKPMIGLHCSERQVALMQQSKTKKMRPEGNLSFGGTPCLRKHASQTTGYHMLFCWGQEFLLWIK